MENEEKAARLIELVKKARAGMPPRPHDIRTPEHNQQCIECREWNRALEARFEKIETEEGMMSGELGMLVFMAVASKANDLAGPRPHPHSGSLEELKQCPECQEWEKTYHGTWERTFSAPPEYPVKEFALGLEWAANTKAMMLPVSNVLEKAINDGELEIPEHRQTHKSQEELLACDICQDWERRRDAIVKKGLGSKPDWL
jgi:hypothetical protein